VSGDVLIDDSLFDRQLVHPAWPREQLYRWYAAPVSALTLADNCVELTASAGARAGSSARLRMSPLNDALRLSGTIVTTASRKDHIWSVYRKPGEDEISCSGRFWTGAEADAALITVNKPSEFFGRVLARVFRDEGIEIRGRVRTAAGIDPSALRPRITNETSLATVVQVANKESQNLYAEQLFNTQGAKR
jgi:D-alanyl-D-alanine carboxypeptidase/D-alanyl-D-alanine-endopeptidase (penicillin-binding protein 4)